MADPETHLTVAESDLVARRRRGRNWAMFAVLVALAALFYAIAIVKMRHS